MTHNHVHCGHFLREAVRQKLGTRLEVPDMFGVGLCEYMAQQSQYIHFMNVPFLIRFCVDAMVQKGVYAFLCCSFSWTDSVTFRTLYGGHIQGSRKARRHHGDLYSF